MSKKRPSKISTIGSKVTTVISVALVLLIVGLTLTITSLTSGASDALRRRVVLVVRLSDEVSSSTVEGLMHKIAAEPYTASMIYTSADEVLKEEMKDNAEILEILGENPYSAEIQVFLQPQYVEGDSIAAISQSLDYLDAVDEVYSQVDVINNINYVLKNATIILAALGLLLLIISVVLLFNTISLVIYSRRFVIRTMQLVGATAGFIRRPFVWSGLKIGMVSAIIASAMLCGLHFYASTLQIDSLFFVDWIQTGCICAILFVVGALLCSSAACLATNRFLRASYDKLYTK